LLHQILWVAFYVEFRLGIIKTDIPSSPECIASTGILFIEMESTLSIFIVVATPHERIRFS
jgi:hypothetical protein